MAESRSNNGKRKERPPGLDEFLRSCADFRQSEVFIEVMHFVGKFTDYAPLNAFLIYTQRPTATFVASRGRWYREFGRRLLPEARPIIILAPMGPVRFIYDVEDTEGKSLPEYFNQPYRVGGQLERMENPHSIEHQFHSLPNT